ncbi:MAG: hypothetical protein RIQ93_3323, partial [Verrucomicrobiota bacterium]
MELISPRTFSISVIALTLAIANFTRGASTSSGAASGNAASTAAVTGRVQNIVTGKYLSNARVAVKGTQIIALTDEAGAYHLVNVPTGSIVLEVFYTDLDRQEVSLTVSSGQRVEQNIELTSKARYGQNLEALKLDPFLV